MCKFISLRYKHLCASKCYVWKLLGKLIYIKTSGLVWQHGYYNPAVYGVMFEATEHNDPLPFEQAYINHILFTVVSWSPGTVSLTGTGSVTTTVNNVRSLPLNVS